MKLPRPATLAALGLLVPLAACTADTGVSPDTRAGEKIEGRAGGVDASEGIPVLTPAGSLKVAFAPPVTRLEKEQTSDLTARRAPEGGVFVPVVWSFDDDAIYGEITRLFGDRLPLEIELVTGGEHYSVTPPNPGGGEVTDYVAVEGEGDKLELEVTYDGLTQTLDGETAKVDKGVAKRLYDLPKTKIRIMDCPTSEWFDQPLVYQHYTCKFTTAVPTPYVVNEWVKPGQTWLAVTVATHLGLFATGGLTGALASYDVVDSTELSTVDGKKPLGTLREKVGQGSATGTLVFDIKGKLPKTMQILREYKLSLNGATGASDAPQKRTVKVGGPVELVY